MSTSEAHVKALLQPLKIGTATLKNRFVMAPMLRCRADADNVPTDAMVKYFSDRASMGLLVTEATEIQEGYSTALHECGIFNKEQIAGWKKVTDAVHAKDGLIYMQLVHNGRATVPCNLKEGLKVVAPSAVAITGHECPPSFSADGKSHNYPVPEALTKEDIPQYVQLFTTAAKNAIEAGFDGVELHGANGYLIDQFLRTAANQRTDEYGGSIENRCRFLFEVLDAVIAAIGNERTALRISPVNSYNDMKDEDPEALTKYICTELNSRKIAFLDVMRSDFFTPTKGADVWARAAYEGVLFTGMGFDIAEAEKTLENNAADAIVFGTKALANPDLVARAIAGAELNKPDFNTFYTHDEHGYNDYPTLVAAKE